MPPHDLSFSAFDPIVHHPANWFDKPDNVMGVRRQKSLLKAVVLAGGLHCGTSPKSIPTRALSILSSAMATRAM